jgi:glycosyl hydrolase group 75 (putative chitosanase)
MASSAVSVSARELARLNYKPPAASARALGPVLALITDQRAQTITPAYGAKLLCRLPDGEIFYDSQLAVDTDGSRFAAKDATGQAGTAWNPGGHVVDADEVPYFSINLPTFHNRKVGIGKGDLAIVIWKGVVAYAVLADVGGRHLGEGSLALHRDLGHECVVSRGTAQERFMDIGIARDVLTIAFPGSAKGHAAWNIREQIQAQGKFYWWALQKSISGGLGPFSTPRFGRGTCF